MRTLLVALATTVLLLGASMPASAALTNFTVSLDLQIGTLPVVSFTGSGSGASSAGVGGAQTLPAGAINGTFETTVLPPFAGVFFELGVGAPGGWPGGPAVNQPLSFDGTTGTMSLSATAYLLASPTAVAEIPLGVVGVGGTQTFQFFQSFDGTVFGNPYQLGMLTMTAVAGEPATIMATGVDLRTPGGLGTLVLVSPATIQIDSFASVSALATLTIIELSAVPEPGTFLLVGAGIAALAVGGRKRTR